MKKIIFIMCFFVFSITFAVSQYAQIGIRTKYGDLILRGGSDVILESKKFIEKHNISTQEFGDILITYINSPTNSIERYQYSPGFAVGVLIGVVNNEDLTKTVDLIITSDKTNLYVDVINAITKRFSYSHKTLDILEKYLQVEDKNSNFRRRRIYVNFSQALDMLYETLSVDIKFNMVRLMLKYLTYDLHNWQYLDQVLCDKIPSYRHSLQRKNMIEYVDSKKENLADWERTELIRIKDEFNKAIQESPIIELTDEILMEEIKIFKTKKKFIKVYM